MLETLARKGCPVSHRWERRRASPTAAHGYRSWQTCFLWLSQGLNNWDILDSIQISGLSRKLGRFDNTELTLSHGDTGRSWIASQRACPLQFTTALLAVSQGHVYRLCDGGLHSICVSVCVSCSVASDSLWPHGLQTARLPWPWDSPGKNTGVDSHCLLQGIFPNYGSNPGLLHCRQILCCLSHHLWQEQVGFPGGASGKELPASAGDIRDTGSIAWSGRESHGQRNLAGL